MLLILKNAERRYKKNGICYVIQLKKIVLGIFPGMKFIAVVSQKVCKKLLIFRRAGFVISKIYNIKAMQIQNRVTKQS